jgi:glycine cleavage system H protein
MGTCGHAGRAPAVTAYDELVVGNIFAKKEARRKWHATTRPNEVRTVVALSIVAIVLVFLTTDFFYQRWAIRRAAATTPLSIGKAVHLPRLDEHVPRGRFVAAGHTWLALEDEGEEVLVGATPIATKVLGEIDRVELKAAGTSIKEGEVIATLRRNGRRIELRSAVDGVIEAVNEHPERDPDMLRRDPFGDGWLYRVKVHGLAARLKDMHLGEDATLFLARELGRLRDAVAKVGNAQGVGATLADGGPIAEGAMVVIEDTAFDRIAAEIFDPARARG